MSKLGRYFLIGLCVVFLLSCNVHALTITLDPGAVGSTYTNDLSFVFDDINGHHVHNTNPLGFLDFVFSDSKYLQLDMNAASAFSAVLRLEIEGGNNVGFWPAVNAALKDADNNVITSSNDHSTSAAFSWLGPGVPAPFVVTYTARWLTWNYSPDGAEFYGISFSSPLFPSAIPEEENWLISSASLSFGFGGNYWDTGLLTVSTATSEPPGPEPVPEPGTLLLLGSGLAGLILYRRRVQR